jgi:alpha-2-macroglobulin
MKHLLRQQTLRGFAGVSADQTPNRVSIRHVGSEEKYVMPLRWETGGIAESLWAIPKAVKLGRY